MSLLDSAMQWATATGPPNWVFVVALLTSPHYWSRAVTRAASKIIARYTGGDAAE